MTFPTLPSLPAARPRPADRPRSRPRRGRALAALPLLATSWLVLSGAVTPSTPGQPGRLESAVVQLTGPKADPAVAVVADGSAAAGGSATAESRSALATKPLVAASGWQAAVDVAAGSEMVGLTWTGEDAAHLSVRSRLAGGAWSPWQEVEAEPDEGPDSGGNGRAGVGPIWLGRNGADRVEVRVDEGTLGDLQLRAMRWIEPVAPTGPNPAGAEPTGPTIHARSEWAPGGWVASNDGCAPAPPVASRLDLAIVHHTVNANDYTSAQVPGILAGIYTFHTRDQGWCDIAYNFVIDRFGRVWQGRSGDIRLPVIGGHAKGFNTNTVGIAMLGQYQPGAYPTAAQPTTAEMTALRDLVAWKLWLHGRSPTGTVTVVSGGSSSIPAGKSVTLPTIIGHRDVSSTSCPGSYVYDRIPALRLQVRDAIAAAGTTPTRWTPFTTPQALAAAQYPDFVKRPGTNTDGAYMAARTVRDGKAPAAEIASRILHGAEAEAGLAPVIRLYLAAYLRMPDAAGLNWWLTEVLGPRKTVRDMANYVAVNQEFIDRYGDLTDQGFVERIYQNVLGRAPDPAGLAYWVGQLRDGMRRGELLLGFSESSEYRASSRSEVDVIAVTFSMLRRMPTMSGYLTWVADLDTKAKTIDQLIAANLSSSTEYRARYR